MKRNVIIMWIRVYPTWQMKFDSKKWWEVMFFLWNQCINSFTPTSRMCLWHLIMNRMKIIMQIRVCPNWHMKFDYKNDGKWSFFVNQSINLFIPMRRMSLWCLIMKRNEIILQIHVCPNWHTNSNSKTSGKWSFFY